jgi:hypothetical protein
MVFKLLASLVKEKINIKFLLASLKTLTNSYDCPKAASNCSGLPSPSYVDFLQCTFMVGFRNNFQDHQAAFETTFRVTGRYRKAGTTPEEGY